MTNRAWVGENLKVVSSLNVHVESNDGQRKSRSEPYLVCLVPEEVNLFESFALHMSEGIGLVPAFGEDIERDFTANRESQTVISELVFEFFDEGSPDTVGLFKPMRTVDVREAKRNSPCRIARIHRALVDWEWVIPLMGDKKRKIRSGPTRRCVL